MSAVLPEKLSDHFTLAEMTRSQTAVRLGIRNVPTPEQVAALEQLCLNVLEPVRRHFRAPVIISSGFRSVALNKAIGGSGTSQHCKGEAADFTVPGYSNRRVCEVIQNTLEFDQLIYEFGERGWVHCSFRAGKLRRQVLSAVRLESGTSYVRGIVE